LAAGTGGFSLGSHRHREAGRPVNRRPGSGYFFILANLEVKIHRRHLGPAQRWHKSPSGVSRCQPLRTRAPQREQMPRTVGGPDPQTGSPVGLRPNFCRRRCHHPRIRVNSIACIITKKLLFSRCGSRPRAGLPHFIFHYFQMLWLPYHACLWPKGRQFSF
jgi:hypothetical protein